MSVSLDLASLGGLLSDASRVSIVSALLDGRALTAKELAHGAGVTAQTASFHLKKLTDAGFLANVRDGRHRYYKLASAEVAVTLRTLLHLAPNKSAKPAAKKSNAVCFARTCYGHLAGRLGVVLAHSLEAKRQIVPCGDRDLSLTPAGEIFVAEFGVDLEALRKSRRLFARQCLDWSERHPHIGGALGFALTEELFRRKWIARRKGTRELQVSRKGQAGFLDVFGMDTEEERIAFF
ncbi:MAG: ArsR/SmtB family transcription factor [Gammaproteobacteria bacterium]